MCATTWSGATRWRGVSARGRRGGMRTRWKLQCDVANVFRSVWPRGTVIRQARTCSRTAAGPCVPPGGVNVTEVVQARLGFFEAMSRVLCHDAAFAGRASRAECWWYALFDTLALSRFSVCDVIAITPTVSAGSVLTSIVVIVTLLPLHAVGVRRCGTPGTAGGTAAGCSSRLRDASSSRATGSTPPRRTCRREPRGGPGERDSGNGGSHDGAATRVTIVPTGKRDGGAPPYQFMKMGAYSPWWRAGRGRPRFGAASPTGKLTRGAPRIPACRRPPRGRARGGKL